MNVLDKALLKIYGKNDIILKNQQKRYRHLADIFKQKFGDNELHYFSTPGRTEISGNHTDHNNGRVLAASINLDSIAAVTKNNENKVILYSEGFDDPFIVDLSQLKIIQEEKETTFALIRGIAARFKQLRYEVGGFNAFMTSDVLPGSGLSSSASVEILIGTIFNALYNENTISPEELAKIGQYAENEYFGKPCGLMDQMACAVGGIISIDFKDPENPIVDKIDFDFDARQYSLLVVDTGSSHADLTDDYANIPKEMKSVAEALDSTVCREIEYEELITEIKSLRNQIGDRALLRATHFLAESERVWDQVRALKTGNFQEFLNLVKESGNSSFKWLQNIYSAKNVHDQGVSLFLAITEKFISKIGEGACRVHGGGFAGTMQVFLPNKSIEEYRQLIKKVFGENKVMALSIRAFGTVFLSDLEN
ncbi:MAG: galactokinase [Calditrichaeota bacterium]|nr:MAG: galactokinase [Calditrichota bacterium]MBL1205601.1 galactokinase [Calditrichota bacterium]NOG45429.1 galactokinase [Calditrichota bacterium]